MISLENIMQEQKNFQSKLRLNMNSQDYINDMCLCLIQEVSEALNCTKFKSWKKVQFSDKEKFKDEIVDIGLFWVNLVNTSGMNEFQLLERMKDKIYLNNKRQLEGY